MYTFAARLLIAASLTASLRALDLANATIPELQSAMSAGTVTSTRITDAYLARIAAYDRSGPALRTVITLNPEARALAATLDAERKAGKVRGPLHGIPIVLKDNFDTEDLPTSAGSQLLEGSIPPDDAFVVKRLREAGAIILAKVNLSEFASGGGSVAGATDPAVIKAGTVPNGFSSLGGQTLNPHDLARGPAGSSGGTGSAIAATFAQFGLGTDTAGSVRGPSAANGIAGLKTTLGLVSRDGVVPLALSFDTVGPMARNVTDLAVALNVLAATDPSDPITNTAKGHVPSDYTPFLKRGALRGVKIGVARQFFGHDPETQRIAEEALATLRASGATLVDSIVFPEWVLKTKQPLFVLMRNSEFKAQIADYLATLKPGYPRDLAGLIAKAHDPATHYSSPEKAYALKYTDSQALPLTDPAYLAAREQGVAMVKAGTAAVFEQYGVDLIFYPSATQPASLIVPKGPAGPPAENPTTLVNESGYPEIVIPAGMTKDGLPVCISFLGTAFTEPTLLGCAYDFEQATQARRLPKHTPVLPGDSLLP